MEEFDEIITGSYEISFERSVIKVIDKLRINIIIEAMDGRNIEIGTRPRETILELKKKIRDKIRFDEEEHRLDYRGTLLIGDRRTIGDCGISEGSIIKVVKVTKYNVTVFAKTDDEDNVELMVSKTDKIIDIKKKIHEKIGLSPDEQRLVYNGQQLYDDDRTVDEYQIVEKSVINVVNRLREMQIFFMTMDGKRFVLKVMNSDIIIDVKKKIYEKIGLSPNDQKIIHNGRELQCDRIIDEYNIVNNDCIYIVGRLSREIQIFVNTMDGRTIRLGVTKNDRIIDIKKKIDEKIGLLPDEHILVYQGGLLEDDKTVDHYQIVWNKEINVVARLRGGMQISVKTTDGRTIRSEVTKNDRIIDLKKRIEEKIGLSPDEQKLVYQGGLLEDNKTADFYGLNPSSVIIVVARLRGGILIYAKTMDGKTVTLEVSKNDRIIDIKKKIEDKIELSPDEQQLIFNGQQLYNDNRTVEYYEIVENSVIDVIPQTICDLQILMTTMNDGRTIILKGTNFDKIIDIKKMIEEKIGLSPDEQIMKVNGTFVRDDNSRLYNYDNTNNCTIDVSRALKINITILTHNMETVQIQVLNNDKIIDVMKKIHDKIGLPSEDQRLEYLGESLDYDKLLCEYSINGNSDVTILKPTKQKTRGICLVISNEYFTNKLDSRNGTKIDEKRIQSLFEPMGYEVKIHRNVRNSDMDNVIEDTKKLVKRSHEILIVFILSHGEEKGVYTSEGALIPLKNICTPFTNTKFPLFAGKPKIFFFVCCQGSKDDPGVDVAGGSMIVYDSPTTTATRVPAMADLFIGYATCPSYVSCRNATEGTFYVSTLCDVIEEHPRWSVVDIHQEVQRILSRRLINDGRHFQMPYCENILREHACFVDQ